MRKLAIIPALAVALGAVSTVAPSPAQAQGWRGHGYGHHYGHGYGRGYVGRNYAYGGRRRGISPAPPSASASPVPPWARSARPPQPMPPAATATAMATVLRPRPTGMATATEIAADPR